MAGWRSTACVCSADICLHQQLHWSDCPHLPISAACLPPWLTAGSLAAQIDAEFNAHMAAVEGHTDAIITGCFALLPRLAEIESMVGGWAGGRVGGGGKFLGIFGVPKI